MRKALALLLLGILLVSGCMTSDVPQAQEQVTENMGTLRLSSPEFAEKGMIPVRFSCQSEDVSPPLNITGIPLRARSLALIMDDPDAPMGTWVHWVVFNISPRTESIPAGSLPDGAVQGRNSAGNNGYDGPCPPSGTHRYIFRLYALDTELNLKSSATKSEVGNAMAGHILAETALTGLFKRKP